MEKVIDTKRKSRNLSEKKRRDQFNNLINDLNHLIDPHFIGQNDDEDDDAASCSNSAFNGGRGGQRKMDKSSVLRCAMEFLKRHANPAQQSSHMSNDKFSDNNYDQVGVSNGSSAQVLTETNYYNTSSWKPSYITDDEFSVQMLEALDAFIVVCEVDEEARIIYSSDTLTNLLNYTGTCNSLRQHDYVSLFDLIAPADRPQIEKLFSQELQSGCENQAQHDKDVKQQSSTIRTYPSSESILYSGNCQNRAPVSADKEYISLIVNFRTGLNLTEIKQKHQRERANDTGSKLDVNTDQEEYRSANVAQQCKPLVSELINAAASQQNQHRQQQQQHQRQQQPLQRQHQSEQMTGEQEDVFMQVVEENRSTCLRSQQSIAEQQQLLMSEGRREEQEHNQYEQQKRQQQSRHEIDNLQDIDAKQLSNNDQLCEGFNGGNNSSDDAALQVSNSSSGSDENDQPSGTASDDASDSNQSQAVIADERRHQYRVHQNPQNQVHHQQQPHHHNFQHRQSQHHHRRPNGQQYELVRLMGTFNMTRSSGVGTSGDKDGRCDSYTFEEPLPPPPPPPPGRLQDKRRCFICIGKLDIPRFSYDLKIIVPPVTGGLNLFHNNQFVSKHTLKWRFLWIDSRAPSIIGYLPFEVLGTSGYDYYHWDDLDKLVISHELLMRDGHASSGPYRFLTKGQQWIWLQTKYSIVLKPQAGDGQRKKLRKYQSSNSNFCHSGYQQYKNISPRDDIMFDNNLLDSSSNRNDTQYGLFNYNQCHMDLFRRGQEDRYRNFKDGPLNMENQYPNQKQSPDDSGITYIVSAQNAQTGVPKRFRPDQESSANLTFTLNQVNLNDDKNKQNNSVDDAPVACENHHVMKHEKLLDLPSNIPGKRKQETISTGDNFLSRNLDQFKFILCTHTVIGFDESDNLTGGGGGGGDGRSVSP